MADCAKRIAHLNRRPEIGGPFRENAREIFARMPAARLKQGDSMPVARRDDARREDARAIGRRVVGIAARRAGPLESRGPSCWCRRCGRPPRLPPAESVRLGIGRIRVARSSDDLPLGRGRQRNLEIRLQPFEPVERHPAAVPQERNHRAGGGIVLFGADARWRIGGKELRHTSCSGFFELVIVTLIGGWPDQPNEEFLVALPV